MPRAKGTVPPIHGVSSKHSSWSWCHRRLSSNEVHTTDFRLVECPECETSVGYRQAKDRETPAPVQVEVKTPQVEDKVPALPPARVPATPPPAPAKVAVSTPTYQRQRSWMRESMLKEAPSGASS